MTRSNWACTARVVDRVQPTSATPRIPNRRGSWRTCSAAPRTTSWFRSSSLRTRWAEGIAGLDVGAQAWCGARTRCTQRSTRSPTNSADARVGSQQPHGPREYGSSAGVERLWTIRCRSTDVARCLTCMNARIRRSWAAFGPQGTERDTRSSIPRRGVRPLRRWVRGPPRLILTHVRVEHDPGKSPDGCHGHERIAVGAGIRPDSVPSRASWGSGRVSAAPQAITGSAEKANVRRHRTHSEAAGSVRVPFAAGSESAAPAGVFDIPDIRRGQQRSRTPAGRLSRLHPRTRSPSTPSAGRAPWQYMHVCMISNLDCTHRSAQSGSMRHAKRRLRRSK